MRDDKQGVDMEDEEPTELPLAEHVPSVARFNRKFVGLGLATVAAVAAISMIFALQPPKQKSPAEIAVEQAEAAKKDAVAKTGQFNLPDAINNTPGDYNKTGNPVPQLGQPLTGDLGNAQKNSGTYAMVPGVPGQPGGVSAGPGNEQMLTPQEQALQAARDQARQEALAARRSPLSFGQSRKSDSAKNGNPDNAAGSNSTDSGRALSDSLSGIKMPDLSKMGMGQSPDQNGQDDKSSFAKSSRNDNPILSAPYMKPLSPYELKAGTIIPGVFITGINSDLPGQVKAQIRENVYDTVTGRHLLLPQGTTIIGEYDSKVTYAQERALLVWTRLILPNGWSMNLEGMPGVDMSGYAGVRDRVNNHYVKIVSGVILGSIIGAGAQVATGGQGSANQPASFAQMAVSGAAQNLNNAGQQITQKNLSIQPTVEIRQGMRVNIFVTKDIVLKPYRRS